MRTFTRVANMSPGLRDTGDEIAAEHINELQLGIEDLQTGDLPIALSGIEGALGAYEPLQNMRAGTVNVLDEGIVADGVTNNEAAWAVLYAAASPGDTIEFPSGIYILGTLMIAKRLHLVLAPGATLKFKDALNASLVYFTAAGSSITGGAIDGNKANQSSTAHGVLIAADDCTVSGVAISNTKGAGVYGYDCNRAIIRGNVISATDLSGVQINVTGHSTIGDIEITGNTIDRSGQNPATDTGKGISLVGQIGSSRYIQRAIIDRNVVIQPLNPANAGAIGIEAWGGCPDALIANNTLVNGYMGVSANRSDRARISANVSQIPVYAGVELADSARCAVTGNTVDGGGTCEAGVAISSSGDSYSTVQGNTIKGCDTFGVHVLGMPGTVISNNTIDQPTGAAITLQGAAVVNSVVTGNVMTNSNTAGYGIALDTSDGAAIAGNVFDGFDTSAIFLYANTAYTFDDIVATGNLYRNCTDYATSLSGGAAIGTNVVIEGSVKP